MILDVNIENNETLWSVTFIDKTDEKGPKKTE